MLDMNYGQQGSLGGCHRENLNLKPRLSPEVQRKAGFSKEICGGDPHGLLHGLVFDEGKSWQANRKRLSKQLHLGVLEGYIEVSHSIKHSQYRKLLNY